MHNIELFDEYAAKTLAQLYQTFPVPTNLDARNLCGHHDIDEYGHFLDEQGNPSKAFDIAKATLDWLVESGYIRVQHTSQVGYQYAVLTAAGLEVLKASPESLKVKETLGDKLVRFTKEGSISLAKEVAKTAISTGVALVK